MISGIEAFADELVRIVPPGATLEERGKTRADALIQFAVNASAEFLNMLGIASTATAYESGVLARKVTVPDGLPGYILDALWLYSYNDEEPVVKYELYFGETAAHFRSATRSSSESHSLTSLGYPEAARIIVAHLHSEMVGVAIFRPRMLGKCAGFLEKFLRGELEEMMEGVEDKSPKFISIAELKFTNRTFNTLAKAGIKTLDELMSRSASDLRGVRLFGAATYEEVQQVLKSRNLSLKGGFPDWKTLGHAQCVD